MLNLLRNTQTMCCLRLCDFATCLDETKFSSERVVQWFQIVKVHISSQRIHHWSSWLEGLTKTQARLQRQSATGKKAVDEMSDRAMRCISSLHVKYRPTSLSLSTVARSVVNTGRLDLAGRLSLCPSRFRSYSVWLSMDSSRRGIFAA